MFGLPELPRPGLLKGKAKAAEHVKPMTCTATICDQQGRLGSHFRADAIREAAALEDIRKSYFHYDVGEQPRLKPNQRCPFTYYAFSLEMTPLSKRITLFLLKFCEVTSTHWPAEVHQEHHTVKIQQPTCRFIRSRCP